MSYRDINNKGGYAWFVVVCIIILAIVISVGAGHSGKREITTEVTTETVVVTEDIPYGTKYVDDPTLAHGKTRVKTPGTTGTRTVTYEVKKKGSNVSSKNQVKSEVTRKPVDEVVARGTKTVWRCVDVTSYDYNWQNDMKCTSSTGEVRYTSYSGAAILERQ